MTNDPLMTKRNPKTETRITKGLSVVLRPRSFVLCFVISGSLVGHWSFWPWRLLAVAAFILVAHGCHGPEEDHEPSAVAPTQQAVEQRR
jgi:hypothetical protein